MFITDELWIFHIEKPTLGAFLSVPSIHLVLNSRKPHIKSLKSFRDDSLGSEQERKIIFMNTDISVVIPVHNGERQITKTVKKLLKQKNVTIEILLIENNSSDDSWKVCQKLAALDDRIIAIQTIQKGTNRARQLGVSKSSGSWVTFMDQDDCFISLNSLFRMVTLVKQSNPVPDIAQFGNYNGFRGVPLKRRFQPVTDSVISIDFANIDVFGGMLFWTEKPVATPTVWSKLYRGDIIRRAFIPADFPLYYCEDLFSNLIIFSHPSSRTFRAFSDAFYCWNWNIGGTSRQDQAGISLMKEYCLTRPYILDYLHSVGAERTADQVNLDTVYFLRALLNNSGWSPDLEDIWQSSLFQATRKVVASSNDPVLASFCQSTSASDFYSILKRKNLLG